MHLVNYQDRYFSGSGMIRLYEFDLRANTVDVQTFSPYWLSHKGPLPALANGAGCALLIPGDHHADARPFRHLDVAYACGRQRDLPFGGYPAAPGQEQAALPKFAARCDHMLAGG